jgi:glyoxylase-like metal-dependent hydrolase (beta-lactamase superfamily II)
VLQWKIGNVTITRVVDDITNELGDMVLPQATPELLRSVPWLAPHFIDEDGKIILSIHALLVESQGQRILVDTCLGNEKERPLPAWHMRNAPFLDDLASIGATRDAVDTVLCTHLHIDHVGFNTVREGERFVPTFPNARYLFARSEWEYWSRQPEEFGPVVSDSVRPIVDAGLADLVEMDHVVNDEVSLEPTPGHTPGHVSVHIRSAGEEAIITGDLIHHPCQIANPDWSTPVDFDGDMSRDSRKAFLERYADRPVLVIGTHFAAPTAGRVVRDGEVYRLDC